MKKEVIEAAKECIEFDYNNIIEAAKEHLANAIINGDKLDYANINLGYWYDYDDVDCDRYVISMLIDKDMNVVETNILKRDDDYNVIDKYRL